jgi:type IV secretion system protein VirD4
MTGDEQSSKEENDPLPSDAAPKEAGGGATPSAGVPIGWGDTPTNKTNIGFISPRRRYARKKLMTHRGEGHLLTVAPTGAGKGRSALIPALLQYPGSTLTIDLKGEAYHVTSRRRRQMGHRVVVIDPFKTAVKNPDCLNPFDLFSLPGGAPDVDCELLAELLFGGQPINSKDVFWELVAKGMLVGLIGLTAENEDPSKRCLGEVLDLLYADDVDYSIAVQLDKHKFTNILARQELCAYLQHESDRCRPSVRSTAQSMMKCLGSQCVREALSKTTFDLSAWLNGDPIDIYLIFPPDKLASHRALLRLILGTLLNVLTRRATMPEKGTLLLLDECAQLGTLGDLRTALTLLRGYGVQVWSMWQDLSQLKHYYPNDWETILNNSAVMQVFGLTNSWMAKALEDIVGLRADELLAMGGARQALLRPGRRPTITRRVDYLRDKPFGGLFDPNPRYRGRFGR